MNRIATTLLNVMHIEISLAIGLVLWSFSLETRAEEQVCFVVAYVSGIEKSRIDTCKKDDILLIAPDLSENNHQHSEYIAKVCVLETIVRLDDSQVPRTLCRYFGKVRKLRGEMIEPSR